MADAKAAYDIFSQAITQSAGLIDQINQIGVVSLRAKAGYEALGGSADTIKRMQDATRGLVDDTCCIRTPRTPCRRKRRRAPMIW